MTFGALSLLCGGAAVFLFYLSGLAARGQWLADPVSRRSNHAFPASRAGGVLILVTLGLLVGVTTLGGGPALSVSAMAALGAGILGITDDVRRVPAGIKFLILAAFGVGVSALAGPIEMIPLPLGGGSVPLPSAMGYALSAVFFLGFVNAFNFMDGLNGMAGSAGIVGLFGIMLLAGSSRPDLLMLALVMAALLYGFTVRNVLTGRIFLGDAGSLSVGAVLAASALDLGGQRPDAPYILAIGYLPFLVDTIQTMARRALRGANIFEPHKEHFYQRLRAAGWSHEGVAALYAGLIAVCWTAALSFDALAGGKGLWTALGIAAGITFGTMAGLERRVVRKAAQPS